MTADLNWMIWARFGRQDYKGKAWKLLDEKRPA